MSSWLSSLKILQLELEIHIGTRSSVVRAVGS